MTIKSKVLAAAATLTLLGGVGVAAATAGTAQASTAGCAFTNGCATLHGTDANGNTVAMDAKYRNKTEIVIGYPDNAGDGATSFDADLHYGKGAKVTSYQDTALQINKYNDTCTAYTATPPTVSSSLITAGTDELSVNSAGTGTAVFTNSSGTSLGYTGTLTAAIIDETYGPSCVEAYTITGLASTASDAAGGISRTYSGSSITQFNDLADQPGKFSFNSSLPAGISESNQAGPPVTAQLNADLSTAVPGTYSSVSVSYTDAAGAEITYAFELVVSGIKSVTAGAGVPFYTFVYAPAGDWTSQCVTDINGSGALRLEACTLGKDIGQDFTVGSGTNGAPGLLSGSQNHVSDLLAANVSSSSCLTDPSTSDPATPQSDAADETPPGGRQLYVNGSCAANTNLWSWGT
jgi:hypothetical protein